MKETGRGSTFINKSAMKTTYKEKIRPAQKKALGGSLRLFAKKVYYGSYFNREAGETVLSVYANLPNGSTIGQMNNLIGEMEAFLSGFPRIRQFQTSIYNPRQANIQIYFTKENQYSSFPYQLKSEIISKELTLGGGSWKVYGLMDQGFSNDVGENAGNYRINMYG